jgi:FkbM family methyltransferase
MRAREVFTGGSSKIRRVALRLLQRFNPGDVTIRHHWTEERFKLHSFRHKGYWWSGKNREHETVLRFHDYLSDADVVIEIGAHIGYFSLLFAKLVGKTGKVHVLEPGTNNLPYLYSNVERVSQIVVHEFAASSDDGYVDFWIEDLTGQNNSMIEEFEGFERNVNASGVKSRVSRQRVSVVSKKVDTFCVELELSRLDFIKIDVEGAENMVLDGATFSIKKFRPIVMVELNHGADINRIREFFDSISYRCLSPEGLPVVVKEGVSGNVFFLPDPVSRA